MKYFKKERYFKHGKPSPRKDKGKRRQPQANSEAGFVKRRRASVDAAVAVAPRRSCGEVEEAEMVETQVKLMKTQCEKYDKLQTQAFLEGVLLPHEKTEDIARAAKEELEARKKRQQERKAKYRRTQAVTAKKQFPTLENMAYTECNGVELSDAVRGALARRRCTCAPTRMEANLYIADIVTNIGGRATWCAVLNGGTIVTPQAFIDQKGPILRYCAAKESRRVVFLSERFREKHSEVTKIFETIAKKWKICRTLKEHGLACASCIAFWCGSFKLH